jgi:ribose/xylose/arabinose/galactoside ABC-type transport system permease subunit
MVKKLVLADFLSTYGIVLVLLLLTGFFSITSPNFLTIDNLLNIMRQVSIVGIASVGITLVLISGGIDLSVGSLIGVAAVSAAILMKQGAAPIYTAVLSLLICTVMGLLNGFLINELKVPPLIATLGTMTSLRGLAFIITGGLPVFGFSDTFSRFGQGYFWIIPIPVVVMILVFILGYIFLRFTKYGRYIYGVGGNEEATRLSGIKIKNIKYMVYGLCGALSGLAGLVLLGRINSGQPQAGTNYEMDCITAAVLGGVSISGGEGHIGFVIVGVLIMGVLSNGMIMLSVDEYVQRVLKGLVLILAVSLDRFVQTRKNEVKA